MPPRRSEAPGAQPPQRPDDHRRQLLQAAASVPLLGLAACTSTPASPPGSPSANGPAPAPTSPASAGPAPVVTATPAAAPTPSPAPVAEPPLNADTPPPVAREFRGAWVATVANIDWPSKPGLPATAQRAEALALLDRASALRLNAIVLQVRPAADAIYPSLLEPWTEYLSGAQGTPAGGSAEPQWDPLAFWITEAHRRGLELHAWINPYRARHSAAKSPLAPLHMGVRQPEIVKRYGDQWWLDPAEPAAAAHTLAVVADLLRRYDIDGLHIDDYFYPYPVAVPGSPPATPGNPQPELPFPDDEAWVRHKLAGGSGTRDDWRRAHVDRLVEAMWRTVRAIKPWVRFGISPFGVGKPALRPPGVIGFSQYDKLYADAERWLAEGWLDYWAPQLYWQIQREGLQFPVLLDYWAAQNPQGRHLWPGLFTSQIGREPGKGWPAREIVEQVALQRSRSADAPDSPARTLAGRSPASGHIHFSLIALVQDRDGIATQLQQSAYAEAALPPATPWLAGPLPPAPRLVVNAATRTAQWSLPPEARLAGPDTAGPQAITRWALARRVAGRWRWQLLGADARSAELQGADRLRLHAVDRVGQLSAGVGWVGG